MTPEAKEVARTAEMWVTSCPFVCLTRPSPDSLSDFLDTIEISIVLAMNLTPKHKRIWHASLVPVLLMCRRRDLPN